MLISGRSRELICRSISLALEKIDEYINKLKVTVVPWAAMILYPRYKLSWIRKHFTNRVSLILGAFKEYYGIYYPPLVTAAVAIRPESEPTREFDPTSIEYNDISEDEMEVDGFTEVTDEVEVYLREPL